MILLAILTASPRSPLGPEGPGGPGGPYQKDSKQTKQLPYNMIFFASLQDNELSYTEKSDALPFK